MTQPNPGPAPAAPEPNQNMPQDPATGPAMQQTTTPPTPPGFQPATGDPAAAGGEDDHAQQLLAAAVADGEGDPNQLGEAGKRAIAAERERAKKAEAATKEQQKQLASLQEQLKALQPAAELFAQFRKVAVPEEEKTDTERLQEELAKLRDETATERRQRWLLEIIQDKGLTREDAEWLRGDTKEELEASADKLAARLAAVKPPEPPAPATPPEETEPATNGQQPTGQSEPAATGPKPDPSQGARGPVDIHAQIQDALSKGDIRTSIALKQQLAAQQSGNQ